MVLQVNPACSESEMLSFPTKPRALRTNHVGRANDVASQVVTVEPLPVTCGGYTYNSEIAFPNEGGPRPVILVFPNYAGKKQFDVDQAMFLAQCGYTAVAVEERDPSIDNGYNRDPPADGTASHEQMVGHVHGAFHAMNSLRADVGKMRSIAHATLAAARAHPAAHPSKAAGIGYCFGGQFVFECVRGGVDLDCVVSFHGLLQTFPADRANPNEPAYHKYPLVPSPHNHYNTRCSMLIEHGDLDASVPQRAIDAFREEMKLAGCNWRLNIHSDVDHGFALPLRIVSGQKYDEAADRRSTLSMLSLFLELWPDFLPRIVENNACGTILGQGFVSAKL